MKNKNIKKDYGYNIILGADLLVMLSTIALIVATHINADIKRREDLKDIQNGKNTAIVENDILSICEWIGQIDLDTNSNGKFDKEDISLYCNALHFRNFDVSKNSKSIVYLDGRTKRPLAYQKEDGEYIILNTPSSYFPDVDNADKAFYDYMSDKKVFDVTKRKNDIETIQKEINQHTK